MKRSFRIWTAFGLCLAVVLAATGWVSLAALRLDRAQLDAQRQAAFEENVRLALWRMDSSLGPLVARENARPYFTYNAFYPALRAYTRMFAEIEPGEVMIPSPLLTELSPYVPLHFQLAPDGTLTPPQVPTGNMRDVAETGYVTHEKIAAAANLLEKLRPAVGRDLPAALAQDETRPAPTAVAMPRVEQTLNLAQVPRQMAQQQEARNVIEWQARQSAKLPVVMEKQRTDKAIRTQSNVTEGVMTPVWVGQALVLARRVAVNGRDYIQGCLLDWPAIRQWLLREIVDLLPAADLARVEPQTPDGPSRRLAALPVTLLPGPVPPGPPRWLSPIRVSLVVAWACVLMAAGAVAALLSGALGLSERRGAFVSAVTHELRTPLTTFRIYTEMLAEDMVPDEKKRRRYLDTLKVEAQRLGHLVENVLAYARLEKNRRPANVETATLRELVETARERLVERARQAQMDLVVEPADAARLPVRADPSAVEQVLSNLVDNACKYANAASHRRIHIRFGRAGNYGILKVSDHGPGISSHDTRRLFRPFFKSAREAANSAPGVGLGLALSRRLARSMGGDLCVAGDAADGAAFVLTLPACE